MLVRWPSPCSRSPDTSSQILQWLCTMLVRDSFSPECQKAAVQSLQLLALCEPESASAVRGVIGPAALELILNADAVQAALALSHDRLAHARPRMEAFLSAHRRNMVSGLDGTGHSLS